MADTNTPPVVLQEPAAEVTFTQAEVDAIVGRRIAKAMKGMPSKEELAEYTTWKANQPAEQERINALTTERDTFSAQLVEANAKIAQFERERYIASKGLTGEDAEFVAFRAAKLVSDDKTFEQAVDELLQDRKPGVVIKTGGSLGGGDGAKSSSDIFNAIIRNARK